jgi:hypothetical protein
MRLGFHGIPEENEHNYYALCDHCADLLIAAERTAEHLPHRPVQAFFQQPSGSAGGYQLVSRQHGFIKFRPFHKIFLFVVMGYQCNTLPDF